MHDQCFYFGRASCLALYSSDIVLMNDYEDAGAEQQERSDAPPSFGSHDHAHLDAYTGIHDLYLHLFVFHLSDAFRYATYNSAFQVHETHLEWSSCLSMH